MLLIIGNIAGIIGWLFLIYSYYKDDINNIILIQIISSIFYCLNYLLLGAYAGLLICLFELIKEIVYYKTDLDDYVFLGSLIVYFIIGYYSFDGYYTLLPVLGSIIDGFTLTKNKNTAVIGGVISNILWVIYDIIILSYSCAITDSILVLSNISIMIFGYSRLIKSNNMVLKKCFYINKLISKKISQLDKQNYSNEYYWDSQYQKDVFKKNTDSILLLKYKNQILGYINYLTITESLYNDIKNCNNYIKHYNLDDITKFYKSKNNYILLESISIDIKYQNKRISKIIKTKFERILKNKFKNHYKIKGIISIAVSDYEKELLEDCKFTKIKNYSDNETLYELSYTNIKEIIKK